ncbi:MAG TPA: hypothetical protein VEV83_15370 [Parafilimonas sp.]|nr:hypothetical protein [Parafilimonas sp.]
MPLTLSANGTSTMIIGTEVTLYNPTSIKRFDGYVDLSAMATGDTIELRVYVLIDTLGAYKQYNIQTYADSQTSPLKYIPTLPSDIGWKLTAKQTLGTARTITWRIYEV